MVRKGMAVLRGWLPLAVAVVLLAGGGYATVQQMLRQGANDPQIQMAEDAAARLGREPAAGGTQAELPVVDVASSLAPYLIVFDAQGHPVAGSARLHGALPAVPAGVLEAAGRSGENRVTWQPEPGVRSAAVIVPIAGAVGGYVLAGRSLREVEQRADRMLLLIAAFTAATLFATLVAAVVVNLV